MSCTGAKTFRLWNALRLRMAANMHDEIISAEMQLVESHALHLRIQGGIQTLWLSSTHLIQNTSPSRTRVSIESRIVLWDLTVINIWSRMPLWDSVEVRQTSFLAIAVSNTSSATLNRPAKTAIQVEIAFNGLIPEVTLASRLLYSRREPPSDLP